MWPCGDGREDWCAVLCFALLCFAGAGGSGEDGLFLVDYGLDIDLEEEEEEVGRGDGRIASLEKSNT